MRVNIRGQAPVPWIPELIIITCNKAPAECFAWHTANGVHAREEEDIAQLLRRIQRGSGEVREFHRTVDYI